MQVLLSAHVIIAWIPTYFLHHRFLKKKLLVIVCVCVQCGFLLVYLVVVISVFCGDFLSVASDQPHSAA